MFAIWGVYYYQIDCIEWLWCLFYISVLVEDADPTGVALGMEAGTCVWGFCGGASEQG